MKGPYVIIVLLSTAVILTLAVCLLTISRPKVREVKHYLIARSTLAMAYLILGILGTGEILGQSDVYDHELTQVITLIIASFQALLFTLSLIVLINTRYVFSRRSFLQLIPVFLISVISIAGYNSHSRLLFEKLFYVATGCYILQLIYYCWFFNKEYLTYQKQLDNFFSEDEESRIKWIKNAFYSALGIGILAVVYVYTVDWIIHVIFIILYTLFYTYFAVKYINHFHAYQYFYPVIELSEESTKASKSDIISLEPEPEKQHETFININFEGLTTILETWIMRKGFIQSGVTLEQLTIQLNTNRSYLSRYINVQEGLNFKQWIRNLRIEEAKRLLEKHPDKPIAHIGEMVGIENKSSFYRQFQDVTGVTPGEYRENLLKEP